MTAFAPALFVASSLVAVTSLSVGPHLATCAGAAAPASRGAEDLAGQAVLKVAVQSAKASGKSKKKSKKPSPKPSAEDTGLAPLPESAGAEWVHAPYQVGACSLCHERDDVKDPGSITEQEVSAVCYRCHDQIKKAMETREFKHEPALDSCVHCHNPHNSVRRKLLLRAVPQLCFECHDDIQELATKSKVKHGALETERSCLNCHNPHAANVEHNLNALPFDLCIKCHGRDDVKDQDGKILVNMKKLLEENPVHHKPVANKDCSACHMPHGSENFRILVESYPAEFYSAYDPKNYALCYRCHNDQILAQIKTRTLTNFRNGALNLHYKHVHKESRGRTCRACHEVHAAKKPKQIRDGVPYGSSGWVLPIKYTKTEDGGQCDKTCHTKRGYDRRYPVDNPR